MAIVVLGITAGFAYKAGQKSPVEAPKNKPVSSLFDTNKLKDAAKKATDNKPNTTNALKNSSGFYRLNGTVKVIGKDSITLTLTNNTTITLATKSTTTYYDGKIKYELSSLTKGTIVMATGTISSDGTFTVSAIQKTN